MNTVSTSMDNLPFPDAALIVEGISCVRGFRTLFEDTDLNLESGGCLQITGINGAGKTSLLRILATLSLPETGSLRWNGVAVDKSIGDYRRALSFLGHRQALKQNLTPAENLRSLLEIQSALAPGRSLDQRIASGLSVMAIGQSQDRPVHQLSAGQCQRVALSRMVAVPSPLWILDEPATALDSEGIDLLNRIIDDHLERNGMLVYTSHQPLALGGRVPSRHEIKA